MHGISALGLGRTDEDNDIPLVLSFILLSLKDSGLVLTDSRHRLRT